MGVEHATRSQAALGASRSGSLPGGAVCRCDQRLLRSQAVRVCASQYGPRFTTGLPHKLYGRVSPSGHWQPRGTGGGRGAAAGGDGFLGGGRRGGMSHCGGGARRLPAAQMA
jgi:hypothetical protein